VGEARFIGTAEPQVNTFCAKWFSAVRHAPLSFTRAGAISPPSNPHG
jgi:hypothetical protein